MPLFYEHFEREQTERLGWFIPPKPKMTWVRLKFMWMRCLLTRVRCIAMSIIALFLWYASGYADILIRTGNLIQLRPEEVKLWPRKFDLQSWHHVETHQQFFPRGCNIIRSRWPGVVPTTSIHWRSWQNTKQGRRLKIVALKWNKYLHIIFTAWLVSRDHEVQNSPELARFNVTEPKDLSSMKSYRNMLSLMAYAVM